MVKRYGVPGLVFAALAAAVTVTLLATTPAVAAGKKSAKPKPAAVAPVRAAAAPKVRAPKPARPVEKSQDAQRAEDGFWAKRTNWISMRAGYAKSDAKTAGDGLFGYGLGYQRMLNKRWGFGTYVQHDLLGHLGSSTEVSVPFTGEFTRHFKWKTGMRPYLGLGGGYYFHKTYRAGADYTGAPAAGYHLNFGTNVPVDDRHLLGLDARVSFVNGRKGVIDPVFGPEQASTALWSVKLNWALAY